ncbi:hypothetical protein H9P43_003902 [Blastocladiella emersonii ATCC 22665]|nr:hypothetical protein H9P43_003902 [Blastocladiella emersonii ATCC 22665]
MDELKLFIPIEVVERILRAAVAIHDPFDVRGLAQYARVLRRDDAPRVTRAILKHSPKLTMDEACAAGNVALLDAWMWSRLPLVHSYPTWYDSRLHESRYFKVMDWWRDSGLPVKLNWFALHLESGTIVIEFDCYDFSLLNRSTDFFTSFPTTALRTLSFSDCKFSFHAIVNLAEALRYTPTLTSFTLFLGNRLNHVEACQLIPALPASLKTLNLSAAFTNDVDLAAIAPYFPPRLTKLYIFRTPLGDKRAAALIPLLPATLVTLHLGTCGMADRSVRTLARHLPPGLKTLVLKHVQCTKRNSMRDLMRALVEREWEQLSLNDCGLTLAELAIVPAAWHSNYKIFSGKSHFSVSYKF